MYCILGEDDSDFETLKVLIRRLANDDKTPVKGKGFGGHAKLLKDGWKILEQMAMLGCTRFVIAHDADQKPVREIERELVEKIIKPSGVTACVCLLVPVQEIEAWLLADLSAASKIFKGWKPADMPNPETIRSPKEYLEKLSRQGNGKPRYVHATHNPAMARHVCLGKISKNCPSFRPLEKLVTQGEGNHRTRRPD